MDDQFKRLWGEIALLKLQIEALQNGKKARKKSEKVLGGPVVWAAYQTEYHRRYNFGPKRNARVNRHCLDLIKAIGLEDATRLVKFYVSGLHGFYAIKAHDLAYAVKDVHSIYALMNKASLPTRAQAAFKETAGGNAAAADAYLSRKRTNGPAK